MRSERQGAAPKPGSGHWRLRPALAAVVSRHSMDLNKWWICPKGTGQTAWQLPARDRRPRPKRGNNIGQPTANWLGVFVCPPHADLGLPRQTSRCRLSTCDAGRRWRPVEVVGNLKGFPQIHRTGVVPSVARGAPGGWRAAPIAGPMILARAARSSSRSLSPVMRPRPSPASVLETTGRGIPAGEPGRDRGRADGPGVLAGQRPWSQRWHSAVDRRALGPCGGAAPGRAVPADLGWSNHYENNHQSPTRGQPRRRAGD